MPNDKGEVLSAQATKTRDLRKKREESPKPAKRERVRVSERCERCHWWDKGNCYGDPSPVKRAGKTIACRHWKRVSYE